MLNLDLYFEPRALDLCAYYTGLVQLAISRGLFLLAEQAALAASHWYNVANRTR